ncbi:hypothetical protein WI76_17585 [Burkholderia ubonensis]|uniref:hypothetical protein n=1 Tax=Burkholderia ubonensis TaxID=101571 RepID=UPI0007550ADD|nr:hypothetical protein [Burkholderia ubonensis]KVC77161.1 hypothetical protein WI76_17585 [Burkholderia ubonensis]
MSTAASARPEQSTDIQELRNQIESIDSMCQVKLEQITALTTTLLRAMETPEFWRFPNTLRDVVGLIQHTADDLSNYVNSVAEEVGCNYIDELERARESRVVSAFRKAQSDMHETAARLAKLRKEAAHE